jgi:hypothetical protein
LNDQNRPQRFPLEKLASPRLTVTREPSTLLTPPPEAESMDWSPSQQQEIRPTYSRMSQSSPEGINSEPSPFYGSLPPVSRPPAWNLRNPASQPPIKQAVERNPFRRPETPSNRQWGRSTENEPENSPTPNFASPRFFPPADVGASTELEKLFDRAFTIKSPGDQPSEDTVLTPNPRNPPAPASPQSPSPFRYLRLSLLAISAFTWFLSQFHLISIPGNYVEIASLSCAGLIAGFALLERFNRTGSEISASVLLLVVAIFMGACLPNSFLWEQHFYLLGNSLLVFLAVQELPARFFFG